MTDNKKTHPKPIPYPADFKRRLLEAFEGTAPDATTRLKMHLENGSPYVGRYLEDARMGRIDASQALMYLDRGTEGVNLLRRICEQQVKLEKLYVDWADIYEAWQKENAP